jgi:hypothetical protein
MRTSYGGTPLRQKARSLFTHDPTACTTLPICGNIRSVVAWINDMVGVERNRHGNDRSRLAFK